MARRAFSVPVDGGQLAGWVAGEGPPVLLLHGGPGLPYEILDSLAAELGDAFEVAAYQQRGLPPSLTEGPFDLDTQVRDAAAVLDQLGWDQAWAVGHSWGGYLCVQLADRLPGRWHGLVSVDPLGAFGDGGAEEFEAAMSARTPEADRARADELDAAAMAGEGSEESALESLRLVWPAYFADAEHVLPMTFDRMSVDAYSATWNAVVEDRDRLSAALPSIDVPFTFVHGAASPMPVRASRDTADRLPDAALVVVPDAGHFVWFEAPGCVRAALEELISRVESR